MLQPNQNWPSPSCQTSRTKGPSCVNIHIHKHSLMHVQIHIPSRPYCWVGQIYVMPLTHTKHWTLYIYICTHNTHVGPRSAAIAPACITIRLLTWPFIDIGCKECTEREEWNRSVRRRMEGVLVVCSWGIPFKHAHVCMFLWLRDHDRYHYYVLDRHS